MGFIVTVHIDCGHAPAEVAYGAECAGIIVLTLPTVWLFSELTTDLRIAHMECTWVSVIAFLLNHDCAFALHAFGGRTLVLVTGHSVGNDLVGALILYTLGDNAATLWLLTPVIVFTIFCWFDACTGFGIALVTLTTWLMHTCPIIVDAQLSWTVAIIVCAGVSVITR